MIDDIGLNDLVTDVIVRVIAAYNQVEQIRKYSHKPTNQPRVLGMGERGHLLTSWIWYMMTSSNENPFRVTGPGEFSS